MATDEYKALRFSIQVQSEDPTIRLKGYQNMIPLSKKLGWTVYQDELISNAKNDSYVRNNLLDILESTDNLTKKTSSIDNLDSYFSKLNPKTLQQETFKIKENAINYYNIGYFSQFIAVFNKFLVPLKNDLSEGELQSFLIKYLISTIIKKQFDLAISQISNLKTHYHNYDISIYIL